ncbi:protein transport protein Sec24A isoform X1 [Paramormyrops kingsleyae]|uniref:protein transport protein Sec24A isoform X1 n=1 Tax=Paramormyrops kingsleyae TaxID=1676925 RepID=UPI003B96EE72
MSTTGYNSQNGAGGQPYANGPSQNPLLVPPSGAGYNIGTQPLYSNQMPAKAPLSTGPGPYNPGSYQMTPPVSSYQGPGQASLTRPPMGPVQPAPFRPAGPMAPQSQNSTPPPMPSAAPYAPQPTWPYGAPPVSVSSPPVPTMGNHVTPVPGPVPNRHSPSPYGAGHTPPLHHGASLPPGPVSLPASSATSSYTYQGSGPAPPPVNPVASHPFPPGRSPYGPPPTATGPPPGMVPPPGMRPTPPPTGPGVNASPLAPPAGKHKASSFGNIANSAVADEPFLSRSDDEGKEFGIDHPGAGQVPTPGEASQINSFDHLEMGTKGMVGPPPPQTGLAGRPTGQSYPSLPPGYANMVPSASPLQSPKPPYSPAHQPYQQPQANPAQLSPSLAALSLQSQSPETLRAVNLLQERNILPPGPVTPPTPCLPQDLQKLNCNPEVFRSTLANIPQTQSLLNKAKLPLGLLLHPFKDLSQLPVVTSSTIVRCRSCRTYINPFVSFLDQRRWKCNLCYRVNDVPEEFMYNPVSRSYGEPHKRPEVQNPTIEFIAPSEYMLRPPQPAVYLFVLDVSHNAVETGYLDVVCQSLLDNLSSLPGDTRMKIGFITFDSTIHFYNLQEGLSQPQMLIVSDIDDIFIPTPDSLLVNLNDCKELVQDLLKGLPQMFNKTMETQSALGPALQAAFKLLSPTGGRASIFQTQLPTLGVGALKSREDPNQRASLKDIQHLSPATDFYKKLALDCSGQQVAVDLFLLSGQYCDLASLGCISRYSAGSVYYYPSYHHQHNLAEVERFQKDLKRYLTRKIGFEAVMRIRCTKGLSIHTFHGNFFVRSTDLLSLPNVNPDAGFAVQMSIEENLMDLQAVSFQAALLYTSSKGERRIRVHTMCLPVVNSMADIFAGADVQAITGLLASMAVDRSVSASLSDARDALTNAAVDSLTAYRSSVLTIQQPGLLAPSCLRLFPLYILALLKQKAFRTGTSTRLDDRVFAMFQLKYQPLSYLVLMIHPALYRVDDLTDEGALNINERTVPQPKVLQLSVEKLNREGAFLMDAGSVMLLWMGRNCNPSFLSQVLGVPSYAAVPQNMNQLPELDTAESVRTRAFVGWLREQRPFFPVLHIVREESPLKAAFMQNMVEDRTESALSYYEYLLHLQQQTSK